MLETLSLSCSSLLLLLYIHNGLPQRTLPLCLKVKILFAQSCLTLCEPRDCSLPGSSVHRILQAKMLEWGAIPISKGNIKQNLKLSLQLFVYNEWHSFRYYQIYQEIKPNDQQSGKAIYEMGEYVCKPSI